MGEMGVGLLPWRGWTELHVRHRSRSSHPPLRRCGDSCNIFDVAGRR